MLQQLLTQFVGLPSKVRTATSHQKVNQSQLATSLTRMATEPPAMQFQREFKLLPPRDFFATQL